MSKDIIGQKFNRLTVVDLHHKVQKFKTNGHKSGYSEFYLCNCECGNQTIVEKWQLTSGKTKSCGCLKVDTCRKHFSIHNLTHHPLYNIWIKVKERCYKSTCKAFPNYGGRGIEMCKEWKNDFISFYNWAINNGYAQNLTLDRIDVNGNYEPLNCRFVTLKKQQNNKRNNFNITIYNRTQTLSEWCEEKGLNYSKINYRINNGWTIEEAFTTP